MKLEQGIAPLHILLTGGTGLIGRHLCQLLLAQGYRITVLTRDVNKAAQLFQGNIHFIHSLDDIQHNEKIDVIVNLSGEPISQRWTPSAKKSMLNSRIGVTQQILHLIARLDIKPEYFLSGSAVGIYGDRADVVLTEDVVINPKEATSHFGQYLCAEWEAVAQQAEQFGVKTGMLRTGIVLSIQGGALAAMLPTFKLGLGGKIGRGDQWFSWIHIEDMVNLIDMLIKNSVTGIINATAPNPVTNQVFTQALGKALHRPTILTVPVWMIKLMFAEMGEELLLQGQRVVPCKALSLGFDFAYTNIDAALADLIQHRK